MAHALRRFAHPLTYVGTVGEGQIHPAFAEMADGAEEVISLGAQVRGANPLIDVAIDLKPAIDEFCRQGRRESVPFDETRSRLSDLAREARERLAEAGRPRTAAAAAPATTTVTEEPRA